MGFEGGRKVLGLGNAFTVVHRGRHGVEIDVGKRRRVRSHYYSAATIPVSHTAFHKMPTLTDSSTRHLLRAPPTRRLIGGGTTAQKYTETDEGFIPLPSHRKDKENEQTYRSIEPSHHLSSSSSDASDAESSSSSSEFTSPLGALQATLKALETKLSQDPSSIRTWLALHTHTLSTVPPTSKNAPKARADISLALLERALGAHPANRRARALRLKYLRAGEDVWGAERLASEWEGVLGDFKGREGDEEVWVEWVDWRVRRAEGGVEGVVEDARRALGMFASRPDCELVCLRVFWRVAVTFRDAGRSVLFC